MAKDYKKGADYRFYYNSGSYGTPTWVLVKAVGDIGFDPNFDDVVVPERGANTGHLNGEADPTATFPLFEDSEDTSVTALIAAIYSGAMVHIAIASGPIATTGTKYVHFEALLKAPLGANRSDPSTYDVTAYKHANSENDYLRVTV
jgi:hypothetical protein